MNKKIVSMFNDYYYDLAAVTIIAVMILFVPPIRDMYVHMFETITNFVTAIF